METKRIEKSYSVAIDTVPLPEKPVERVAVIADSFGPVLLEILKDVLYIAIGTWPTPE